MGYKVKINSFAAILRVFSARSLAGISRMFLALPMVAVLKISFDHLKILKPWGILLDDENLLKNQIRFPKLGIRLKI